MVLVPGNENGGGPSRLTQSSNAPSTPVGGAPTTGWTAIGCILDGGSRALTEYSYANDQMTVGTCISACASKNYCESRLPESQCPVGLEVTMTAIQA